jgi:phosphoribosyl 1,2-cyclic phosphodiesterase
LIRTVALASGSNGNSIHVETTDASLLFDAGLSGKKLLERARLTDVDLTRIDALLISHNHSDHVGGAGVMHRRYGLPLFATRGTWSASRHRAGKVTKMTTFRAGETIVFGNTTVHTIPTPHDGRDGVAYVVEHGDVRLGILTDLGHSFSELEDTLPTLDATYLEANYDPEMLANGFYPEHLKDRIAGPGGHLSNEECAELALQAGRDRLKLLILSHLSGENNTAEAAQTAAGPVQELGVKVEVAGRHGPSEVFTVGEVV